MKEKDRDIAIIHLCTTNDDHDLWFLSYGVQKNEFSSFWTIFAFIPITTKKIKILNS